MREFLRPFVIKTVKDNNYKKDIKNMSKEQITGEKDLIIRELDNLIGKNLGAYRSFIGIDLKILADSMGVSMEQLTEFEQGAVRISAARLSSAANAMGLSLDVFYLEMDAPNRPEKWLTPSGTKARNIVCIYGEKRGRAYIKENLKRSLTLEASEDTPEANHSDFWQEVLIIFNACFAKNRDGEIDNLIHLLHQVKNLKPRENWENLVLDNILFKDLSSLLFAITEEHKEQQKASGAIASSKSV